MEELAKSRVNVVYVPTCLRVNCLRANMPKSCQFLIFTCLRDNKRANLLYGVRMF